MAEQAFRPAGLPISGRVTPAAFPFYTTGEDNLRIVSYNALTGVRLKLTARLLGTDGRPTPENWDHTPNTDRSAKSNDFALSGLTLLNLQVSVAAGTPSMGQTYVIVQLIRGIGTAAIVLGTIASGYVTPARAIGWPGSPLESPQDGGGYYRNVFFTIPVAGAAILETCPTGARWEIEQITVRLDASAQVANRQVVGWFVVQSNLVYTTHNTRTQVANESIYYTFSNAPHVEPVVTPNFVYVDHPLSSPLILRGGDFLNIFAYNMQTGDQWGTGAYAVREYLEP